MAAPAVQNLDQIIAGLNPAYQASKNLIGTQQAGLANKYGSQRTALDATKVQGFNDINTQAVGKGLAFSGIPVSEQANYLSTKYLPGMQALNEQQNTEGMTLQQSLNDINKEQRLKALDTRSTQQSALQTYLENERQRQFTSQQNALDRAATAANTAANNASKNDTGPQYTWKKQAGGGYDVVDASGKRANVDLATAVGSQGGGISNLVSLLNAGSKSDRAAVGQYQKLVNQGKAVEAYNYLVNHTGAFYTGGGF